MKKQVLFVILEKFADYEYPLLANALNGEIQDNKTSPYEVKTLSVSTDPIKSIGGFTIIPDYGIDNYPADYAAIVLIGGNSWRNEEAKKITPLLKQAFSAGKIVAAICDATVFLAMNEFLNDKKHTSNSLNSLTDGAREQYTGSANYVNEQAVRDGNLITANGTAYPEFAKEVLSALEAYSADDIENYYNYFKLGLVEMMKMFA
ncbi:MAG: glutamine amidotransferase [Oscillospiraceae bacterium]|jgi:putative intracellular protease/amidase|nr:glutamine amidotransferase [Oscillospiraceae bacterium]